MEIITYVMLGFAVIAGLDRIIGNRFGLGAELERGIHMLGPLTLSMTGMLILAPVIAGLLGGAAESFPDFLDFSIIPASLLANDMGGAPLATSLAADEVIGAFNGLVVASMMGCTVSFTIPYVLGSTDKKYHADIIYGMLCGVVTIPVGCLVAGMIAGIPLGRLLLNLVPLILFAGLVAAGILFLERITVKIFTVLGLVIQALVTVGLLAGIIEYLTGFSLIPGTEPLPAAMDVIINIACIMAGAFPLLYLVRKLLAKPLRMLGGKLGINEAAALGLFSTLATSVATFGTVGEMDRKGIVINSAFAVPTAFALVDHLAFTLSYRPEWVPYMIAGKLIAGVLAVALAHVLYARKDQK